MKKCIMGLLLALSLFNPLCARAQYMPNYEETRFLEFVGMMNSMGDDWAKAGYSR